MTDTDTTGDNAGDAAESPIEHIRNTLGGGAHRDVVSDICDALSAAGHKVTVPDPAGSDTRRPDAKAEPQRDDAAITADRTLHIEAETSVPTKPNQLLTNIATAMRRDAHAVIAVPPGTATNTSSDAVAATADAARRVLDDPPLVKTVAATHAELYTAQDKLRIHPAADDASSDADADDDGAWKACRPADAAHRTTWRRSPDGTVRLVGTAGTDDGDEEVFAAFTVSAFDAAEHRINAADAPRPPAYWRYDHSAQEHIVRVPQRDGSVEERRYGEKDAFRDAWVDVSTPFIPAAEFPHAPRCGDDYTIVIVPAGHRNEIAESQVFEWHDQRRDDDGETDAGDVVEERVEVSLTPLTDA